MYLKTIFTAPDIQRQLPHEAKAFTAVDKQFKDAMRRTKERTNAMQAATTPGTAALPSSPIDLRPHFHVVLDFVLQVGTTWHLQ